MYTFTDIFNHTQRATNANIAIKKRYKSAEKEEKTAKRKKDCLF